MTDDSRPRVLLADDHVLLLDAFARLLEESCDVVGTASDGRSLVEEAVRLKPDVVVMDISMPELNGLEAGRQIRLRIPETKIIYVTVNEDPDLVAEAFRLGASGYLLKSSAGSELFEAIRQVMRGKAYVTPLVAKDVLRNLQKGVRRRAFRELTPRQREVLQLLAEGRSMKETAATLGVTPRTVAFHKYRIMDELGLKSNAELVQFAIREGIIAV